MTLTNVPLRLPSVSRRCPSSLLTHSLSVPMQHQLQQMHCSFVSTGFLSLSLPFRALRSFLRCVLRIHFLHFHLISSCNFICLITSALCTSHLSFVSVLSACEWRWCAPQDCWRGVECSALLQRNGTFERKQLLV